ncbi:CinA family nicotinamide mononucleotide deamidase-related protein [Flavobacterium sp. HJ-32-4]|uniref:CinA family nicotinamide mononucleotide deamidase-related protein n=1 Tax=Flavobacterium sp. HJ-32-4 TaxID=1160795 RepID=UPI001F1406B3|nr:CinA family nicotinamide mononucleotide deamidase-related protein [Flavobacterium sp. HJ-32-4]UMY67171.1 CinA family nicotinamide mononucleotide deamidase-related protein [Flavobacterium sp. HJ-32-4]
MKAAIITIGDEILIGQIVDSNSAYMAKALDAIGVAVYEMASISDSGDHIRETFAYYQDVVDIVLVTGGLGPTKDDITKKIICEYFDDTLVTDEAVLAHVTRLIEQYFKRPITQLNRDQALVPSKAVVLHNEYGTAPGIWMRKDKTVFVFMPGVPFEMKGLMEKSVIPRIQAEFERPFILHKTLLTYGMGESLLAETIATWEENLPETIKLAYLPAPGRVRLRLSARGRDKAALERIIDEQVALLQPLIGHIITGFEDGETIEVTAGKLLAQKGLTLALGESCTGGRIAQMLTSVPGASAYFRGGVVSYTKEAKIDLLGVNPDTIAAHTVVSAAVAEEMAQGAQGRFGSDYGIGVTGNAGPTTDDTSEEVGTVYIALATPEGVVSERFSMGQPRAKVIERAAVKALEMLQKEIFKNVGA